MPDSTSHPATYARHSWTLWLVSIGYWTLEGLLNSGSEIIDVITGDIAATPVEPVVWELTSSYTFALLTPFLVLFAWRHRFERVRWLPTLALYLAVMIVFVLLHVGGMVGMRKALYAVAGSRYEFGDFRLETGEHVWNVPLGTIPPVNEATGDARALGSPNLGGPIITAGGLVFIAATLDQRIRAFDIESGDVLWEAQLPAGGRATPITYQIDGGRQLLVVTAGGGGAFGAGDYVVAFAIS